MTPAESKQLKKGDLVYWRGDADDSGVIADTSWDAVTINWSNCHVAIAQRGDMREIVRAASRLNLLSKAR